MSIASISGYLVIKPHSPIPIPAHLKNPVYSHYGKFSVVSFSRKPSIVSFGDFKEPVTYWIIKCLDANGNEIELDKSTNYIETTVIPDHLWGKLTVAWNEDNVSFALDNVYGIKSTVRIK